MLDEARLVTLTAPAAPGRPGSRSRSRRHASISTRRSRSSTSAPSTTLHVVPTIAAALRLRATPGVDPLQALHERLGRGNPLLVLDNLEQLASEELRSSETSSTRCSHSRCSPPAASRCTWWVSRSIRCRRSRSPATWTTSTCPTSHRRRRCTSSWSAPGHPGGGFQVTDGNAAAVAEIVARLDGLPLALELAASRMRVLDPASLAGRLERRLPLLTDGPRDAPERQRTLEGTIRWSEEALPDDARRMFARLAVFPGGCTVDATEAVCGDDLDVLDALGTLVDHSLIRRSDASDGSIRFSMLETIREYAQTRLSALDASERSSIERRQADVRELAERAEPHLTGQQQLRWIETLDLEAPEHPGRARRSRNAPGAAEDVATGLRTAAALWVCHSRGPPAGEARTVALAAARASAGCPRALALGAIGSIDYWLKNPRHDAGAHGRPPTSLRSWRTVGSSPRALVADVRACGLGAPRGRAAAAGGLLRGRRAGRPADAGRAVGRRRVRPALRRQRGRRDRTDRAEHLALPRGRRAVVAVRGIDHARSDPREPRPHRPGRCVLRRGDGDRVRFGGTRSCW